MKTFQQISEAIKTPHQVMVSKLGFPKSTDKWGGKHGEHESGWSKRGGYAGAKTIDRVVEKAKALGFKKVEHKDSNSPDGNVISYGTHYHHPDGHHLTVDKRYGVTKTDNHYSMHLKHKSE